MTKVLVSPVGLYRDRVLKGIKWLRPDWIFLLVNKGKEADPWVTKTNEYGRQILEKIKFFYEERVQIVPCDYTNHETFFCDVNDLVIETIQKKLKKPSEIWIDLTSVPEIQEVAVLFLAAIHRNIRTFYTKAKEPLKPDDYPKDVVVDKGGDTVELPVVRSVDYGEIVKGKHRDLLIEVVKARKKGQEGVKGLSVLLERIGWSKEKKYYMRLGRILEELERYGMVIVERIDREKLVRPTMGGEMFAISLKRYEKNQT